MKSFKILVVIISVYFSNNIFPQNKAFIDSTLNEVSYLGGIGTTRDYVLNITEFIPELNEPLIKINSSYIDSLSISPEEYYSGLNTKYLIHEEMVAIDSIRYPKFVQTFGSEKSQMAIRTIHKYSLWDEYQSLLNHQTYNWIETNDFIAYYVDKNKLINFYRVIYDSCYVRMLIDKPLVVGKEWEQLNDSVCYKKAYVNNLISFDTLGFDQTGFRLFIETGGSCGPDSAFEYWGEKLGLVFREMHWTGWTRRLVNGNYIWVEYIHQEKTILDDCNFVITSVDEKFNKLPDVYSLEQNYPNPFNPSTTISWQNQFGSWQTIKLYNVLGQEIETVVDEYFEAGIHSKLYIAKATLPSGMYFYQLKAGNYSLTKKMLLIK